MICRNCQQDRKHKAHGLCGKCYKKYQRKRLYFNEEGIPVELKYKPRGTHRGLKGTKRK
jgi:hypothetical protein